MSEPSLLAEIWPLSGHLEVPPADLFVLLRCLSVAQLVLLVVDIEEVVDDSTGLLILSVNTQYQTRRPQSTYLPSRDSGVWVFQSRSSAVRVLANERLLLQIAKVHVLCLVRNAELLKDDGDLPWVWSLDMAVELQWFSRHVFDLIEKELCVECQSLEGSKVCSTHFIRDIH